MVKKNNNNNKKKIFKDLVVQQTGFHLRFSMRKTRFNSQQNWLNPSWLREILRLTRVTAHTADIFPSFYCVVPYPLWSKRVYMWPQEVRGYPFYSRKCSAELVADEQLLAVGTNHSFYSLHKTLFGFPSTALCSTSSVIHLNPKQDYKNIHIKKPQGNKSEGWPIVLRNACMSAFFPCLDCISSTCRS